MDKTELVSQVATLFRIAGHKVETSVDINHSEIDVVAQELQGIIRKTVLVECTEEKPCGIKKFRDDLLKLRTAQSHLGSRAVIMHVALYHYSKEASGLALDEGVEACTLADLKSRLVNFEEYITAVERDKLRPVILDEYQPTSIHFERAPSEKRPALDFIDVWLKTNGKWLTLLGDYGVGKSWTLRRLLYNLLDRYKSQPSKHPLPFLIPLQRFTKAFEFDNLLLATLQMYGLSGVHLAAFKYLASHGGVVFLYDSFDEMAQTLNRATIRENFRQLVEGMSGCRAILTSRPTYFEGKAERFLVVEQHGTARVHRHDELEAQNQSSMARYLREEIDTHQFARLNDLTATQRKHLFAKVLKDKPEARKELDALFSRFEELKNITQRAVIARLLTTVAETLASSKQVLTPDGYPLLPDDLTSLNQAKIFEIVVNNLLHRDAGIGELSAGDRLFFLRRFAVFLQQPNRDVFAEPGDIRAFVEELFKRKLDVTDFPQQQLDSYYRACRRHSGLTTETQFKDTSGQIDIPVDVEDTDSRVGFSHNSLREFLVADCIADCLSTGEYTPFLETAVISEAVGEFFVGLAEYRPDLISKLSTEYLAPRSSRYKELVFRLIYWLVSKEPSRLNLLGSPLQLGGIDLSGLVFSGLSLSRAQVTDCVIDDSDFRKADLREALFARSIIRGAMFDGAELKGTDLTEAEINSIYVYDEYDTETTCVLQGKSARQWLFSHGAKVSPTNDLNPLLGKKWYEAAREVCRTLQKQIAGTRKLDGLWKGTNSQYRNLAKEFAEFLLRKGLLEKKRKSSKGGGWVIGVPANSRRVISEFADHGKIDATLAEFFEKRSRDE
jgi:uncharacterized protein YjbI with pentapeptide repeats